ncbi:hypothetical protein E2C01_009710 [Portunus trituberculatus]|uniref:Secreted protein n=1 Tax=Portunus trituberculatus TaxID=210409 RepID=A0A5B7D6G4_PORTR|nr:hypothetical protein [Portunus trituberculatus]
MEKSNLFLGVAALCMLLRLSTDSMILITPSPICVDSARWLRRPGPKLNSPDVSPSRKRAAPRSTLGTTIPSLYSYPMSYVYRSSEFA